MHTLIPNQEPIELISYYEEFAWYYPNCEPETKQWVVDSVKKDWNILDIGANIGYYSILFSRMAPQGKVYAFEPTSTYDMLLKNLAHHKVRNIQTEQLALGKTTGNQEERIYRIWGNDPEVSVYPFTTIDEYTERTHLPKLDLIKIDVDSFDFEVLQGAEKSLERYNPVVMVELNHALARRNQSPIEAFKWLSARGYQDALVLDNENFILQRGRTPDNAIPGIKVFYPKYSK